MNITIYDTGHDNGAPVCAAFAQGLRALGVEHARVPMQPLRADGAAAFFYGVLRGGLDLLRDCLVARRRFYFADNGYLGPRGAYYRLTRDARFCAGLGPPDFARLDRLRLAIAPWVEAAEQVLICPPPREYDDAWRFDGGAWLEAAIRRVRKTGGRAVAMRYRPDDPRHDPRAPPITYALKSAWALVTHESNLATEALIAGVPVFVTGEHPARAMSHGGLRNIDHPLRPDNRRDWLGWLAANQWTLEEFGDGTAARALGIGDT